MGFCGCSLRSTTITAGVLSIIVSILRFVTNVLVIVVTDKPERFELFFDHKINYTCGFETRPVTSATDKGEAGNAAAAEPKDNEESPSTILTTTFPIIRTAIGSFKELKNGEDLRIACIVQIILCLCWLVSGMALLYGNKKKSKLLILQWIPISAANVICHVGIVGYGISRLAKHLEKYLCTTDKSAEIIVFIALHGFGIILWLVMAVLCFYVYRRAYSGEDVDSSEGSSSFRSYRANSGVHDDSVLGDGDLSSIPKWKFLVEPANQEENAPAEDDRQRKPFDEPDNWGSRPNEQVRPKEKRPKHTEDGIYPPDDRQIRPTEAWESPSDPHMPHYRKPHPQGRRPPSHRSNKADGFPEFSGADRSERMRRDPSIDMGPGRRRQEDIPPGRQYNPPREGRDRYNDQMRPRDFDERYAESLPSRTSRPPVKPEDYRMKKPDDTQSYHEPSRREHDPRYLRPDVPARSPSSASDYRRRKELPLSDWQEMNKRPQNKTGDGHRHSDQSQRPSKWAGYNGEFTNPVYEEDEPDYNLDESRPTRPPKHYSRQFDERASRF